MEEGKIYIHKVPYSLVLGTFAESSSDVLSGQRIFFIQTMTEGDAPTDYSTATQPLLLLDPTPVREEGPGFSSKVGF